MLARFGRRYFVAGLVGVLGYRLILWRETGDFFGWRQPNPTSPRGAFIGEDLFNQRLAALLPRAVSRPPLPQGQNRQQSNQGINHYPPTATHAV